MRGGAGGGVTDDYHGQYPKAFIKLRGGESLSSESSRCWRSTIEIGLIAIKERNE